jgi:hypothetical protein
MAEAFQKAPNDRPHLGHVCFIVAFHLQLGSCIPDTIDVESIQKGVVILSMLIDCIRV